MTPDRKDKQIHRWAKLAVQPVASILQNLKLEEISANAHEMRECLRESSCSQMVSHFIAVHSWSVRCSQKSQKSIKPLILEVHGLSKSLILI